MKLMKHKKYVLLFLLLLLVPLFSSCTGYVVEDTQKLFQDHKKYTAWLEGSVRLPYRPLSEVKSTKGESLLLCLYEITDVALSQTYNTAGMPDEYKGYHLTIIIKRLYGNSSGQNIKEAELFVICPEEAVADIVGREYLGFIDNMKFPYAPWTFLVVDKNVLVSPYGDQTVNDAVENGEYQSELYNFYMESRDFTGKSMNRFIAAAQ